MNNRHIYTEQIFSQWNQERESKEQTIEECKKNDHALEMALTVSQHQLDELTQQKITPLTLQLALLSAHIQVVSLPAEIDALKNDQIADQMLTTSLNQALEKNTGLRFPLKTNVAALEKTIAIKEAQETIEDLETKLASLRQQMNAVQIEMTNVLNKRQNNAFEVQAKQLRLSYLLAEDAADRAMHESERMRHVPVHHRHYHGRPIYNSWSLLAEVGEFVSDMARTSEINTLKDAIHQLGLLQSGHNKRYQHLQSEYDANKQECVLTQNKIDYSQNTLNKFSKAEQTLAAKEAMSEVRHQHAKTLEELRPLELQHDKLKRELHEVVGARSRKRKNIERLTAQLQLALAKTEKCARADSLAVLKSEQEKLETEWRAVQMSRQSLQENINTTQLQMTDVSASARAARKALRQIYSHVFFKTFWQEPQVLILDLRRALSQRLRAFDEEYPAQQSVAMRSCLSVYEERIDAILGSASRLQTPDMLRQKYLQLTGMVYNMLETLGHAPQEAGLIAELQAALGAHCFDPDFVLPYYRRLAIEPLSEHDLFERESRQVNDAKNTFLRALSEAKENGLQDLVEQGNQLIAAIDDKLSVEPGQLHPHIDMHFYTHIFRRATVLAGEPDNVPAQQNFKKLIDQTQDGRSSLCKKIAGCLLGFLGATLIAASIVAHTLSFGLASPLLAVGTVVGCGLMGTGLGLFGSGRQKALAGSQQSYFNAAKKSQPAERSVSFAEGTRRLEDESEPGYRMPIPSAPAL